ncbi:mechanosensitive ion channel family protein [Petrachloros mirabilis]
MREWMRRERHRRQGRVSRWIRSLAALSNLLLPLLIVSTLDAAPPPSVSAAPVHIGDQTVFTIHTGLANIDAAARAQAIETRLARLTQAHPSIIQSIAVEDHEQTSYVVTPNEVLFVVTENEAKAAGRPRHALAEEQAGKIREVLLRSLETQKALKPTPAVGLRDLLWAGVATALLIFVAIALRVLFPLLYEALEAWRGTRLRTVSFRGLELLSADQLTDVLLLLGKGFQLTLAVIALYAYMHYMLGLFPWTQDLERTLLRALATPLEQSEALRANLVSLFIGLLLTLIATGVFLALLKIFQQLFPRVLDTVSRYGQARVPSLKLQRVELLSKAQITEGLLTLIRVLRFVAIGVLIYFYATSLLGFFPWTRTLSVELLGYVVDPIKTIGLAFAAALPDMIAIAVIVFVTRYIVKLIRMIFISIERGAISFAGFHREWAIPTYKIVRFLVLVFAAVAIFPYIPGSRSEAFKGISVFLGILVSLGAAGAISNIVAGVVLTYMRPFDLGDRVKIADTVGDVTEKTLLVTRIRTVKNVDITIPNSQILGAHIINYSSVSMSPDPLILNTSVTIGYDAPWRTVHDLLKQAAAATTNILTDPEPFVLQTSLNDFYVTYELNAYTGAPNKMAVTYSELHQNIQDKFNEAGVEIMSPHYAQIRDGNKTAIPDQYLPMSYQAPAIRIEGIGKFLGTPTVPPPSPPEPKT